MKFKLFILFFLLVFIITSGVGHADKLKIGVMYLGSVKDAGWNQAHYNGIMGMKEYFGDKVDIIWVDGVGGNYADVANSLNMLIAQGCKLIFTTAWDFMDATINIAKQHPDIIFEHCSGYKRSKNVGTYFVRIYNMDYLAGIVAGSVAKKGSTLGLVLPQPIPEVVRQANAFAIGVKKTNPNAKVQIVWTHSWYDPATESEFAQALIEKGVSVIAHGCDSPAVVSVAEKYKVPVVGYGHNQSKYAPTMWLTAPLWNWKPVYISIAKSVMNKTWKSQAIWDIHGATLAPISDKVDTDIKALVQSEYNKILNGYKVFGKLTDKEIWDIYFLVDNIIGTIPK